MSAKRKAGKADPLEGYTFTRADPAGKLRSRLAAEWARTKTEDTKAQAADLRRRADALDPPAGGPDGT